MMNINRLNPAVSSLWDEMDNLFSRTFFPAVRAASPGRFQVNESDEGWTLQTDLPGYAREDLEVEVENGVLHIAATESEDNPGFVGGFDQRIRLSSNIDPAAISARLENGVLEIRLPRKESEQKPNFRIEVN